VKPEQFARLKIVFQEALDQPSEVRRRWLREECGDDTALLREAESLLTSLETAGDFLEKPAEIDPGDLDTLPAGSHVGPYRILEEVGRGGMGVVYLAEDTRLNRRVALKALPAAVAMQPDLRERLRREARAAATISHPAVAVVYALEEVGDHLFIASEYVEGETLRNIIAQGPLAPERARSIASDIAGALSAAHDAGVIHRDLKPENVLIKADGSVKVVDFGIAQMEGANVSRLTRTGFALGTPAYMAPEQLLGSQVDPRADVYAWGVVLSEMLHGRHPLDRTASGAPPERLEGPFTTIIGRCLQADPTARPSARELVTELRRAPIPTPSLSGHAEEVSLAPAAGTTRWWWEFHQGMAALIYSIMVVPGWYARGLIGGAWGRAFFITLVASVIVAATLRLHLWFTSRFYESELTWVHDQSGRWIKVADWVFAGVLVLGGLLIRDERSPLTIVLPSVAIGAVVAFLLIEPVTARAAFRRQEVQN
jgi:predicted Ser/Thr protein kinase